MASARDNFERREQESRRSDSEHDKSDRQLLTELVQRARRTETRTTKIANHLGIDAGNERPELRGDTLYVPSLKVSLQDILEALGERKTGVTIYCGEDYLATVQM